MPFTPYHFGINALPGLLSRGRLDICTLIAANVLIDVEVLADNRFAPGWPVHQLWHFHTLLIGGCVGLLLGAAVFYIRPFRRFCGYVNFVFGFAFQPTLLSLVLSGLVGAWLHVLVDGLYHYDVQMFWPIQENLLMNLRVQSRLAMFYNHPLWVVRMCLSGWGIAMAAGAFFIGKKIKSKISS